MLHIALGTVLQLLRAASARNRVLAWEKHRVHARDFAAAAHPHFGKVLLLQLLQLSFSLTTHLRHKESAHTQRYCRNNMSRKEQVSNTANWR